MNKDQLRQLIREELQEILEEDRAYDLMKKVLGKDKIRKEDGKYWLTGVTSREEAIKLAKKVSERAAGLVVKMMGGTGGYGYGLQIVREATLKENVAQTILQQLGGRRFVMMTGAKNLVNHGQALSFRIGRNSKNINYVKITLTGSDLYDMEFGRIQGSNYTVKSKEDGVYNDMLQKLFTKHTGMYTSL